MLLQVVIDPFRRLRRMSEYGPDAEPDDQEDRAARLRAMAESAPPELAPLEEPPAAARDAMPAPPPQPERLSGLQGLGTLTPEEQEELDRINAEKLARDRPPAPPPPPTLTESTETDRLIRPAPAGYGGPRGEARALEGPSRTEDFVRDIGRGARSSLERGTTATLLERVLVPDEIREQYAAEDERREAARVRQAEQDAATLGTTPEDLLEPTLGEKIGGVGGYIADPTIAASFLTGTGGANLLLREAAKRGVPGAGKFIAATSTRAGASAAENAARLAAQGGTRLAPGALAAEQADVAVRESRPLTPEEAGSALEHGYLAGAVLHPTLAAARAGTSAVGDRLTARAQREVNREASRAAAERTLDLEPGASPREARRAYRETARETHPDTGVGDTARREAAKEAAETLKRMSEQGPLSRTADRASLTARRTLERVRPMMDRMEPTVEVPPAPPPARLAGPGAEPARPEAPEPAAAPTTEAPTSPRAEPATDSPIEHIGTVDGFEYARQKVTGDIVRRADTGDWPSELDGWRFESTPAAWQGLPGGPTVPSAAPSPESIQGAPLAEPTARDVQTVPTRMVPEAIEVEGVPAVTSDPSGAMHAVVRAGDILRDPDRFQFKRVTREGVQQRLRGDYDPFLAGTIDVIRDPADGKLYVFEGHHRHLAALEAGEGQPISVRIHDATPEQARQMGAVKNIAEGNATPTDAAKFIREEGITPETLESANIDLRADAARLGFQLANLPDDVFTRVATGDMTERMGAAIGGSGLSEAGMRALEKLVRDRSDMTIAQVQELARFVEGAGETTESQETLFGTEELTRSNALEKAKLSASIKRRLSRDRNLFGYVGRAGRAARLSESGAGEIEIERAQGLAQQAAQLEEAYERLSSMSGPVADALNAGARDLAAGGKESAIIERLYADVVEAIRSDPDMARVGGLAGGVREGAAPFEGQRDLFSSAPEDMEALRRVIEADQATDPPERVPTVPESTRAPVTDQRARRFEELMEIDEPTRAQYDELTRLADEMDVGSRGPKLTGPISVPGKGVFDSETGEMLQEFKPLRGPGGVSRPTTTEVPDDTELVDSPPEADARQPVTRLVADLRGRLAVDGDVSPERRRAFGAATAPGRETNAVLQAIATAEGRLSAGEPDSRVTDELYDEVKGILDTETGGLSGPTGQVREAAMPLADGPRLDGLPRLSDELPEPPATQWDPDPAKVRAAYDKFNFAQHNVTFDEVLDHLPEVSAQQPPPWDTEVAGRIRQENIRSGIPPMSKEQHAVAQAIGDLSRGKGLELRFRDQEARELEGLTGQVREGEQVDAFGDDLRGAQEEMELGRVTPRRLAGPSGRGTLAASERLARTTVDRLRPIVESGEATPDQREQYRQAVAMLRRNDALSAEEAGLLGQSETPPDTESGDLFGEIEGPGRPPPGRVRETDTNSLSPQPGEDVRAYTDRIKRQRDERRQAALDVVREEYGGLELGDRPIELGLVSMGDRRHVAAITPSTEPSRGAVRATFFNEDGPWTHQYYASVEDAVASISDDHGVASAAPGSVDELFRLESFQKGLEHIKKIAEWNRRLAAGEEPPPPDEIDVGEVREDVPQFNSPEDVPANAGWIAEQLGLFSDNVTWGSPEKAAAAKKNIAAANAKLLSELSPARREQEVADAVRRREENILTIDHRGKQISSDPDQAAKDVALLQAPFRGPDSEHLSAYLTVNGEVAGHVMVTSGKVNYTGFEDHHTADIEALIKQHGVTDAWLSHNHPSGRSISSPEDDTLTGEFEKWFASRGVKLRGHVVIDHGTAYEIMTKQSLTYDPAGVPDWTRQRLRKEVVNSPAEIAKMAGPIAGPDALSLLFVDTMGKVVSLSPESKGLVQALSSPGWLFDRLTGLGAYRAFIAIDVKNKDFDGLFDALVNAVNMNGLLRAIPHKGKAANQNGLLDIVGVDGFSLVRSARNKGLLYFTPESTTHARRVMEEPDDNVQGSGEPGAPSASARPVGSQPTAGPAAVSRGGAVLGLRGPGGVAPTSGRLGGPQGREGDPARPTGIVRDVESQFDEVEKRWRAAKGLGKETESRALDALDAVRKSFLRHFRYIDQSESAAKSHTHDILRRLEAAPNYAKSTTADQLVRINADMGPADRDQLARLLVLPDILKDVEAGLYDGKDLPFGYESPSDIASDLQRFQDAASPQVQEALERRREIAGDLTQRMVDAGLLPKKVLEDDRYYHRQVLDYFRLRDIQFPGTGSADARLHTKGFQRQRVGGGDFNTRWQEAEFEWMSQAESLLQRKAALDALESVWNIKPGLKRQARAANRAAFAAIVGDADAALKPFSTKIAIANDGLGKLAEQGSIPSGPFDHVWAALGQERAQHNAARAALPRGQKGTQPPLRFQHEDWFPALAWLLEQGGEGAGMAGSIFKAIAERERLIKETVGNKYVTWEDLVPDAHPRAPGERAVTWQPEKGNHFFLAPTVQERVLHRAQSEMRPLTDDETRMMLVMGGPKEQWVVPESIQRTLDEFGGRFGDDVGLEQAARYLTSSWKQWVLLNPVRAVKYNVNNQSGDMDIAIAYKPEIVTKRMVPAARDLALWRHGSDPSPEMQAEMDEALRLGVIDSGLTIAEIPEINDIGVFRKLADPGADASAFQNLVDKYWNSVRAATTWRENTLRLAAWRYFLEHPNETGVSNPEHVAGIPDERERAAKLARELIGDYGNLSEAGMWLRKHALPFWSWAEINAPRYVRLFRNTQFEGTAGLGKAARVGGKRAAGKGAKFLIQANILFGLINLWNWTQHPEEAAELQRGRRQLHLILGRREDGSIRSVRFQGALSDALEWINLGDWPADIADIMEGKADLADIAAEAAKGPVEKLVNMVNPFASTAVEMFTGRSAFPRLFEEGASLKPRPSIVRDRKERAFAMWSLDGIYRRVTGKPRKPTTGPVNTVLDALITYSTDPGEASYWLVRGETVDWMRESGREFPDVTPTERSNALYYFKKATAWGDEAAADRWLRRYYELGGTAKGLQQSVRRAHPLGAIPQGMRASFIESLNERDREALRRALQWYTETYGSRANTDATEPGETPARGRLNGPRQAAGGTGGR